MSRAEFKPKRLIHVALDHAYRGGDGRYITLADHSYRDPYLQTTITVPRGFRTDFASFPRLTWAVIEREGPWARAALFHDWLYRTQPRDLARDEADSMFKSIMQADGVAKFWRVLFYVLLAGGGWWAWRTNAKRLAAAGGLLDLGVDTALVDDDTRYGDATAAILSSKSTV